MLFDNRCLVSDVLGHTFENQKTYLIELELANKRTTKRIDNAGYGIRALNE